MLKINTNNNWYTLITVVLAALTLLISVVAFVITAYIDNTVSKKITESNIHEYVSNQIELSREESRIMQSEIKILHEKIAYEREYFKEVNKLNNERIGILENEISTLKENQ